jgi:hypothetical protein
MRRDGGRQPQTRPESSSSSSSHHSVRIVVVLVFHNGIRGTSNSNIRLLPYSVGGLPPPGSKRLSRRRRRDTPSTRHTAPHLGCLPSHPHKRPCLTDWYLILHDTHARSPLYVLYYYNNYYYYKQETMETDKVKKATPSDFLKSVLGRPVKVQLNSGLEYRGVLACLDGT